MHTPGLQALLRRSSHYWETIISAGEETSKAEHRKYRKQRNVTSSFATSGPTIEDVDIAGLVEESQMALANIALYKKDTTRALRLYSRVKTPHAAWNQSQVNQFVLCMYTSVHAVFPVSVQSTVVSRKSTHWRSTIQVCQRGWWVLF